jgi:hypothetical protein
LGTGEKQQGRVFVSEKMHHFEAEFPYSKISKVSQQDSHISLIIDLFRFIFHVPVKKKEQKGLVFKGTV